MSLALCILFAAVSVMNGVVAHWQYRSGKSGALALSACAIYAFISAIWLCDWISHE